jgi:hypothetical protein
MTLDFDRVKGDPVRELLLDQLAALLGVPRQDLRTVPFWRSQSSRRLRSRARNWSNRRLNLVGSVCADDFPEDFSALPLVAVWRSA